VAGGCGATSEAGYGAGRPAPADMRLARALILSSNWANRLDSEGGVVAAVVVAFDDDGSSSLSRVVCFGIVLNVALRERRSFSKEKRRLARTCRIVKPPWKKSLLTPVSGAVTVIQHTHQLHLDGDRRVVP
jgi:hypothetical protein